MNQLGTYYVMTSKSVRELEDLIVRTFKFFNRKRRARYMMISTIHGDEYLVHSLDGHDWIKENHLIFTAYYKTDEVHDKSLVYGVAVPISLIACIQIHVKLPKKYGVRYTEDSEYKVGFKKGTIIVKQETE